MSLTTVSRHPHLINCALAVAPVTDWYFYGKMDYNKFVVVCVIFDIRQFLHRKIHGFHC